MRPYLQLHQRRFLTQMGVTAAVAVVIFYFSYHMISGERGLSSMFDLSDQLSGMKQELDLVQKERKELEQKVNRLYAHSLDQDLLDEEARRVLGYAKKDEVILYMDSARPSSSASPASPPHSK